MPEIKSVLATVGYRGRQLIQLKQIFDPAAFLHCRPSDEDAIGTALQKALAEAESKNMKIELKNDEWQALWRSYIDKIE